MAFPLQPAISGFLSFINYFSIFLFFHFFFFFFFVCVCVCVCVWVRLCQCAIFCIVSIRSGAAAAVTRALSLFVAIKALKRSARRPARRRPRPRRSGETQRHLNTCRFFLTADEKDGIRTDVTINCEPPHTHTHTPTKKNRFVLTKKKKRGKREVASCRLPHPLNS